MHLLQLQCRCRLRIGGIYLLNLIYCELLKLKKSYIMLVVLIGGIFSTILMNSALLISAEKQRPFEIYASNIEQLNFVIFYNILFSLIAGYVFSREFADKTSSILYTYPIGRFKIFISKLITICILISLVYLVEFISIYLGYYIIYHTSSEVTFISNHMKFYLYSLFFQFLIIPISILIGNLSRNIMMPIVYGVVGTIVTGFHDNFVFLEYIPFSLPFNPIKKLYNPNLIDLKYSVISGIACFIISMFICIYHYNKQDIA